MRKSTDSAGTRRSLSNFHCARVFAIRLSMPEITRLLQSVERGDAKAAGELLPLVLVAADVSPLILLPLEVRADSRRLLLRRVDCPPARTPAPLSRFARRKSVSPGYCRMPLLFPVASLFPAGRARKFRVQ